MYYNIHNFIIFILCVVWIKTKVLSEHFGRFCPRRWKYILYLSSVSRYVFNLLIRINVFCYIQSVKYTNFGPSMRKVDTASAKICFQVVSESFRTTYIKGEAITTKRHSNTSISRLNSAQVRSSDSQTPNCKFDSKSWAI